MVVFCAKWPPVLLPRARICTSLNLFCPLLKASIPQDFCVGFVFWKAKSGYMAIKQHVFTCFEKLSESKHRGQFMLEKETKQISLGSTQLEAVPKDSYPNPLKESIIANLAMIKLSVNLQSQTLKKRVATVKHLRKRDCLLSMVHDFI